MTSTNTANELELITALLGELGFTLENEQPHLKGERSLMQAVTTQSGKKFILLGRQQGDNRRVVIKITNDLGGKAELEHEQKCRKVLQQINFAYDVFFSPEEILFTEQHGYTISVQAFIEQECAFLDRPLKEQFTIALKAFKGQESAHATTYAHTRLVRSSFGSIDAQGYLEAFTTFKRKSISVQPKNTGLKELLEKAHALLSEHLYTIEQYSGFLTHVDFVPHNIRVSGSTIYLLDHSALRFGNKYEGWARFVNFMTLYNRPLEAALVQYVRDNRTPEESLALKLMRIYRLGEIIWYYIDKLEKTSGDLHLLTEKRVQFWSDVLGATLNDAPVDEQIVEEYKKIRDTLRSEEEKKRQIGLH